MRARHVPILVLVAALALVVPAASRACGHCREDKIAATYDWAVVSAARRNGHAVVYTELRGPIAPGSKLEDWIRQQAQSCAGVDRGTVRVSLAPPALSFACDGRKASISAALRGIGGKLSRRGLSVNLIEAQAASGKKLVPEAGVEPALGVN